MLKTNARLTAEEQAFAARKEQAKKEIEDYKSLSDYRAAEQTQLTQIVSDGKKAVEAATTDEQVAAAIAEAKSKIDALKTKKALDAEDAQKVMDIINAIGTVTADSEEAISAAREAYNNLPEDVRTLVDNYDSLLSAETELEKIQTDAHNSKVTTIWICSVVAVLVVAAVVVFIVMKRKKAK